MSSVNESKLDISDRNYYITFLGKLRIDIMVFLLVFASAVQNVTVTRIQEQDMCFNQLHSSLEFCFPVADKEFVKINKTAVTVKSVYALKPFELFLTTIPPAFFTFFLSIWIDAYPKYLKYLLSIPCLGMILQVLILLANGTFFELNAIATLASYIPYGFFGGTICPITAVYVFIARTTPFKDRCLRFAILNTFVKLGSISGTVIGGIILKSLPWETSQPENYIGLYASAIIAALIWQTFFLPVSKYVIPLDTGARGSISSAYSYRIMTTSYITKDIFKLSNLRVIWLTWTRKRPENGRLHLWLLLTAQLIIASTYAGSGLINFEFTRKIYEWDPILFSIINTLIVVIPLMFTLVTTPILTKTLHMDETTVAIIGSASILSMNLVRGLILDTSGFIISYLVGCLSGLVTISIRSIISKLIDEYEIGQVFSVFASLELSIPTIMAIIYHVIFKATFDRLPGLIFWISSGSLCFPFFLMIYLRIIRSKWHYASSQEIVINP